MAQSNRNPRTMVNKFDSTCGDCGRHVDQGETILYHGRGYIQCNECAPVNTTPNKPVTSAQAWENALAWDDSTPDKGASIGGTATAVKRVVKAPPVMTAEVVELAKAIPSGPVQDQESAVVDSIVDPLDDISATDRAEALTTELLLILINAIDVAGITGRHGLQAFCKVNAGRSIEHSTRAHLWHGIAQAIQRA